MPAVSETLQQMLEMLQQQCQLAGGMDGKTNWMLPPQWDGNTTNLAGMATAFDRSEPDQEYRDAISKPEDKKAVAVCMSRQTELAYLGMMERAFRMRHLSPSRALSQAATIRSAHGMPEGVHIGVVLQYIQNMLAKS